VSNLSKTPGIHIKSFINIHYIHSSFPICLAVCNCFAFKKYIGTFKFPFRSLDEDNIKNA
jgi:hypothetical protein